MLKDAMQRNESALQRCVQEGWGSTITIGVTIAKSGTVQQVEVLGSFAQTPTGRCLTQEVRKARFPAFTQGETKQLYWTYQVPTAR